MGTWGSSRTQSQALVAQHPGRRVGSGSPAILTFAVCLQDAMRSVTKQAIREARLKEIKEELLHSEKLKVRGCGRGTERGGFRALPFLEAGGKAVGVRGGELGSRRCL